MYLGKEVKLLILKDLQKVINKKKDLYRTNNKYCFILTL